MLLSPELHEAPKKQSKKDLKNYIYTYTIYDTKFHPNMFLFVKRKWWGSNKKVFVFLEPQET
jgi:hypothetical protein